MREIVALVRGFIRLVIYYREWISLQLEVGGEQFSTRLHLSTHTLHNILHFTTLLGDCESDVGTYLATVCKLEEEVEDSIGNAGAERVLQIHLVALQHHVGVLCAPVKQDPDQVVLDHGDGRMGNVLLLLVQAGVNVLLEALRQLLDDNRRVCDLLAV